MKLTFLILLISKEEYQLVISSAALITEHTTPCYERCLSKVSN